MKALFLSLPAHGHTNPTLPLVRELAQRGEEVAYCTTAEFAEKVREAGARFRPYRCPQLEDLSGLPERLEELAWLLMQATESVLETELESFRQEAPDYVLTDSLAPWGHWVGEVLGIPVITSIGTFAVNRSVLAYNLAQGARPKSAGALWSKIRHLWKAAQLNRRLQRRFRLRGPGLRNLMSGRSELNIVYTSRHFQPCASTFDGTYRFVGPSIAPRPPGEEFPWGSLTHPVIVYVSLGTLFHRDAGFYRKCFEAMGRLDCQVVLSAGSPEMVERLQDAPGNFIVRARPPQLEILQRASAFLSHGGMNSVSESFHFGVPVLVVPQMSEQYLVGRRVQELGAGVCIRPSDATPEALRGAMERLLHEEEFRRQAAAIRASFQEAGGPARAAAEIVDHVKRSRPALRQEPGRSQ